jgi:hypothetical protein
MTTGVNGSATGEIDRAARGSRRRFRALSERGRVRNTICSPRVPIQSGTLCGEPSACGEISRLDRRCAHCGEPMHAGDVELLPGPGAAV